jgi:hypothetical protein
MRAKIFLITTALSITFSCVNTYSQSQLDLKNKPIKNELLVEILNDSEMKELKPPLPKHSNFFLRLYSIGELGTCAPEVETEVTCSFRYYLAVSDGGLGVPRTVYDLGEVGEITNVKWLENADSNVDKLRLEISNYPTHAFELNPKLKRETRIVELDVSLSSLKIKVIK